MSDKNKSTAPVRVPLNTHPSHLHPVGRRYGAFEDETYSPAGSPPHSIRSHIESFAGSYSRASALYMAENLSYNPPEDTESLLPEEDHIKSKIIPIDYTLTQTISSHGGLNNFPSLSRHVTVASIISQQLNHHPQQQNTKSTFVQSIFNSVNVLVGIGVLALPLGFRCAGWLFGSLIFFFCTFATNYTAKLIAKCLDFYPNSTTYGDMGAIAFGDRGRAFVSVIFVVELMTIG